MKNIFITGGTGYIGTRLIKSLLKDENYTIHALVRNGSENKLPDGCNIIPGNALDSASYIDHVPKKSIFIHLIGVAHPSPSKKEQFQKIDLVSIQEAVKTAVAANASHFIYLSVSMYPTKIMKDYQEVRAKGEQLLLQSKLTSTFIRPWYVLGPGHWWPILLKPFFLILQIFPSKRQAAIELNMVTIKQMINTLVVAVKSEPIENNIYTVQKIREIGNRES